MAPLTFADILAEAEHLKKAQTELETTVMFYGARRSHGPFEADLLSSKLRRYNEEVANLDQAIAATMANIGKAEAAAATTATATNTTSHSRSNKHSNKRHPSTNTVNHERQLAELQEWLTSYYQPYGPRPLRVAADRHQQH